jgi:hypothetical protein
MLNLPNVKSNVRPCSNQIRQITATTVSLNNKFSCAYKETGESDTKLTNNNIQEIEQNSLHFGLQVAKNWQIWISHNQAPCVH